ncbi:MAG: T9SS type A sorting domain-containing protein [Lentimicrobiaceae bacterium]|jgi:hypothetical protein|nr:T9SS type A sorting domain-containing protein [Lentimicrobiaceae bacterium]
MKKILLSMICVLAFWGLSAQVTEDFSDYTVGGKLAQQAQDLGRDYWTTWSSAPGGAEDGTVADVSGNKVGSLTYGNDQVLLLGGKTSGVWEFSMKMFVPTNKCGYFNIVADFAGTSSVWALQVYFGVQGEDPNALTPGVGTMHITASNSAGFTFAHDAWTDIKVIIDLDTDNAEIYINNDLIYEWQYSLGTFGAGCPRVIDAMNIFPPVDGVSDFYIDDIVFQPVSNAIHETNFDELTAGDYVAQSYPEWWTTWSDAPATAEDALITTEQAASTPNSAKLAWGNDLVFKAGDKTTGAYTIDFDMYIPGTSPAFFNILHAFAGTASEWAVGIYFNITETTNFPATGTYIQQNDVLTNFTIPSDTWFPVSFMIDLDNDNATVSINGSQLLEWQFSTQESGGSGLRQLGAIDFYPPQSTSTFYIDNFAFGGISGGVPSLDINVAQITEELGANGSISKDVTITNSGSSIGDYASWISLNMDAKEGERDSYTLTYTNEIEGSVFVNGGDMPLMEFAAKYPLSYYCDMVGTYLTKISYFLPGQPYDGRLVARVYGQGSTYNAPGEILSEGIINNPTVTAWNEFSLPEPILLDGQDIWVAFEALQATGDTEGLMATDAGIAVENSDWTRSNGGTWHQLHITQPELNNGNFMIKAYTEGYTVPGCWVSLTGDTYGAILAGEEATFQVNLTTEGLPDPTKTIYDATIYIATNDVEHELFEIPVRLDYTTGIGEFTSNGATTKVYPVPTTDMVTIESTQNINDIQVVNNIGQVVYSSKVDNTQTTLNTAGFNSGVYFVRVNTETGLQTVRLIVQ